MKVIGKVQSQVRQAWYRWLELWTLSRADRRARTEMNARFLENPHEVKWTAPIGWPYEIARDRDGEYRYLPANGGRRRPPRWLLRRHLRNEAVTQEMIERVLRNQK